MDIKEISVPLNGRLENTFMYLSIKVNPLEEYNDVYYRIRIASLKNTDTSTRLEKEKYTVALLVNNEVIAKAPVVLDFKETTNVVALEYNSKLHNLEALNLKVEAKLFAFENESHYIDDTSLEITQYIKPIVEDRLFIDLSCTVKGDFVYCSFVTTVEPDLIEYKVDSEDWIMLGNKEFSTGRSSKNQYIQVRGKYKNKYSYSNVCKIYKQ